MRKGTEMDLGFLHDNEVRDVLDVLANAFIDRIMVEEGKPQSEAFLEVAGAVNVGRALSRERQAIRRIRKRRLELVPS